MTKHLIALEVRSIGKSLQLRKFSSGYFTVLSFISCISNSIHGGIYQGLRVTLKMWLLDRSDNELILVKTVPYRFHLNFFELLSQQFPMAKWRMHVLHQSELSAVKSSVWFEDYGCWWWCSRWHNQCVCYTGKKK